MSYLPVDSNIREILSSDVIYSVPRYQRKYVWNSFNWADFLGDLERTNFQRYHFLGCLIFERVDQRNERRIVDGQQRLTTSLILLSLLGKYFASLQVEGKRDALRKYCFWTDSENVSSIKLSNSYEKDFVHMVSRYCFDNTTNQTIAEFLQEEPINNGKSKIVECFKFFEEYIQTKFENLKTIDLQIEYLEKLRDSLLELRCISITAEREQEGYLIFEVLNSRGMPLSQHELIKNYIFMHDSIVYDSDTPLVYWKQIVQNIELPQEISSTVFDSFLSDYILHKFGEKNSKQTEYGYFRDKVLPDSVHSILLDLVEKSKLYKKFLYGVSENPVEKYVFNFFLKFKIRIVRPILLSLSVLFSACIIDKKCYDNTLLWLKNYFAWYVVVFGQRTNTIDAIIKKATFNLQVPRQKKDAKNVIAGIKQDLIDKLPKDKVFVDEFQRIMIFTNHKDLYPNYLYTSKNKNACRFALEEYEIAAGKIEDYTVSRFSIEHVKDDSKGGSACLIGNLIPLQSKRNNALSSKTISDKLSVYRQSNYRAAIDLSEYIEKHNGQWDDNIIEGNTKRLATLFETSIWPL
nr:DUF262 domain-containing protein [uncultured Sphaerochaeta sp.]